MTHLTMMEEFRAKVTRKDEERCGENVEGEILYILRVTLLVENSGKELVVGGFFNPEEPISSKESDDNVGTLTQADLSRLRQLKIGNSYKFPDAIRLSNKQ